MFLNPIVVRENLSESAAFKNVITTILATRSAKREVALLTRKVQDFDALVKEYLDSHPENPQRSGFFDDIPPNVISANDNGLNSRFKALSDILNGKDNHFTRWQIRRCGFHEGPSPYIRQRRGGVLLELKPVEKAFLRGIGAYIDDACLEINGSLEPAANVSSKDYHYFPIVGSPMFSPNGDEIDYGLETSNLLRSFQQNGGSVDQLNYNLDTKNMTCPSYIPMPSFKKTADENATPIIEKLGVCDKERKRIYVGGLNASSKGKCTGDEKEREFAVKRQIGLWRYSRFYIFALCFLAVATRFWVLHMQSSTQLWSATVLLDPVLAGVSLAVACSYFLVKKLKQTRKQACRFGRKHEDMKDEEKGNL